MANSLKGGLLLVACIGLSFLAWRIRRRWREDPATGRARVAAYVGAALLGVACAFAVYPYDESTRICGFPFPAALFQRSKSGQWLDFIGLQTFIFPFVNGYVGAALGYGAGRAVASRLMSAREDRVE